MTAPRRLAVILSTTAAFLAAGTLALPARAQSPGKTWIEKAAAPSPVAGQKRLALILGNTHYGGAHELKNPENDAKAIAAALGKLGFVSTVLLDGSREQMRDAVNAFAGQISDAGEATVALIYYSGHGMQVGGENYLIPVGFKMPTQQSDIGDYALSAQKALDKMQSAKAQVNIAILDACRDNPFEGSRSLGGRGLAKLETQGILIAYATAAGRTADDNAGDKNGLYTKSLLKFLGKPGMKLYDMFKNTSNAVYEASKHEQVPYVYDGLIGVADFYLMPGNASTVEVANASVLDTSARLTITTNVSGATVMVNDAPVADGEYAVDLGLSREKTVEVGIAADGYVASVQTVKLLRGKTVMLPVVLAALPPKPVAPVAAAVVDSVSSGRFTPPLTLARYKAQMVRIPAGEFTMGIDGGEGDEKPAHKVMLSAYRIGRTDVTVGMYEEFCQATKRAMPSEPNFPDGNHFNAGWGKKDHPMVNVSWDDAQAYCTWAHLKLPSEAQWEKAARGSDGREFPWGNEFDTKKLWCSTAKVGDAGGTRVVGDFPAGASPYGCLDMAGNVWQWCADTYDEGFYGSRRATETDPVNESPGDRRVLRGGSWYNGDADYFRCANRDRIAPTYRDVSYGFRAVLPGLP